MALGCCDIFTAMLTKLVMTKRPVCSSGLRVTVEGVQNHQQDSG